jgi:hypothetical protein
LASLPELTAVKSALIYSGRIPLEAVLRRSVLAIVIALTKIGRDPELLYRT